MDEHRDAAAWTLTEGEYSVRVSRVSTRNGERLRIERISGGMGVDLDAIELESLTVEGLDLTQLRSRDD